MESRQAEYVQYAQQYLVGGVSSSFRINPFTGKRMYLSRADGPYIYDLDGKEYIDFFMGHGACTLGHNRADIKEAVRNVIEAGFYAEYDNPVVIELAKKIVEHVPSAERVRYVTSGSEGTLLAMRLARGYTGRKMIVRIDGHFHGGHDYALPNNLVAKIDKDNPGDRLSKIGHLTAGVPEIIRDTIYVIPWNQPEVFEKLAREKGHEIAAIIMNPIDFNNGCITTTPEYLQAIRRICTEHGIVMILDEILAGFKTGITCGQGYYGVTPDLCLLGKALTNGVPLGAIAGKEEIMMKIMDPVDPVIAGGTFTGNLMGCAAGVTALGVMEQPGFFDTWLARADRFLETLQAIFDDAGLPAVVQHVGCGFGVYLGTREPVRTHHDVSRADPVLAKKFFSKCIEKGMYFHTDFTVSAMHDQALLDRASGLLAEAAKETVQEAQRV
ncbi:MAG TPA: aminotransferase class III-fold pyridoxal phosphate-dependent enzyme [Anaerolineaceae bacterium]|nr:aminotransferase class III-fold pyridoxal phosphate-dependent enzyme [Anaerolineaceae bacterium]